MAEMEDDEYQKLVGTHKPGSITRIELRNFLTHGHAVINPGPRLNMVVGANGTGKSTILNAICLCMGGDPKLLGRADDVREFIMHDMVQAEIQIDLQNFPDKEKHSIRRVIDRNKGSERGRGRGASVFYINGEKASIQDVRNLVSNEYGISIDNLCTFLPQDKVGNFSGFSDQCRLLETEKTLSKDGHYYDLHQKLIAEESDMERAVVDVDSIQDNLKKLQHEFERLEREKELAEEREKALKQIELLNLKRLWLEFEALRAEALQIKDEKDKLKQKLKDAKQDIAPLETKYNKIVSLKKEMESKHNFVDQNTQRCMKEIEKQEVKYEKHDDEIEVVMSQLNEIDSKRAKSELHLQECQQRLDQLEEEWKSFPPMEQAEKEHEERRKRLNEIKADYETAKREDRAFKSQFKDLEEKAHDLQNKLAKMNDDVARRREKIFREKRNLGVIYEWLTKHRSNFRKPVTGPIAADVTTKSQHAASYLEFHVSNNVLCSFVVETKEDYNLLYDAARNELKVPVNILLVSRTKGVNRMYSAKKMEVLKRDYDVECYLDETFTAPESVMQALRDYASVDKVLVGGEKTQECIDHKNLLEYLGEPDTFNGQQNLQGSCIFASNGGRSFRYLQTVSRYSKELGSRIDEISPTKLLAKGVDPNIKKEAEDQLAEWHREISELRPSLMKTEKVAADLEADVQQANLKVQSSKKTLDNLAKFESKMNRQRSKVEEAKNELEADDSIEKNNLVKSLMGRLVHTISAMESHAEHHQEMIKFTIASAGLTVNKTVLTAAERSARNELTERKQFYSELEKEATRIHQVFKDVKQKVAAKKREAESVAPIEGTDGKALPLKEQLSSIEVNDITEVDAAIEDIERSIEGIHENPDAMRQYAALKDEIELLKANLDEVRNSRETRQSKLDKMLRPWESALDNYISKINCLFTNYMGEMGCTGEVRLKKGSSGDESGKGNFKEWGIEILVSFREGAKAQVLSAERHSGGERSVSTIMYLMALQDLMAAPFRCVDEINQGLDDRNERLVFKRIVENSTRKPKAGLTDHSGQYFLITPKLLPNLTDMEEHGVTILFVFNGVYNHIPVDFDFSSLPVIQTEESEDNNEKEHLRKMKRARNAS